MATNTFEAFYLGVFSDLDPDESDFDAENSGTLVGQSFGGPEAPLYNSIDSVTSDDTNNNGTVSANDNGQSGEPLTYNGTSSTLDSVIEYNVTITYLDGTTATTKMVVLQDISGRTFLAPFSSGNSNNDVLNDKPIESITLDSVFADSYGGLNANTEQNAFIDGTVNGTSGDDNMGSSYTDADGTQTGAYGGDDTIDGGAGNDTIRSGADDDVVYGGDGNDDIDGGGNNDRVYGDDGNDLIDGGGGNDTLYGGDGNDTIEGGGTGSADDLIYGGDGDDVITDEGNSTSNDTIYGGAGSDTIDGGDGNDTIYGGENPDTSIGGTNTSGLNYTVIDLGLGAEIDDNETNTTNEDAGALLGSYGGPGAELYNNFKDAVIIDTDGDGTIDNDNNGNSPETITIGGVDKFVDNGVVYNATVTFTDGSTGSFTAVVIQTTDGNVYMMPEFSDNADNTLLTSKPIQSISLDSVNTASTGITASRVDADYALPGDTDTSGDSIQGGTGNDSIIGGQGDDTIDGGEDNDTIYGGDGADSLRGWSGDDYIDGGAGNDILEGDEGTDTVIGGAGDDYISLWTGADSVEGGDGQDTIRLHDNFGNDTIIGGEGGTDNDAIDLTSLTGPVTVTYTSDEQGTITDGTDTITFSEIENIFLTDFDDSVDGSADTSGLNIFANDGDDTVLGGTGNDTLSGGDGNDTLQGGAGADQFNGGAGLDIVDYSGSDAAVNIDLQNQVYSGGDATGDTLAGMDGITGSAFDDSLTGFDTSGADWTNVIDGGAGNDTIDGRGSDDTLIGGSGDDSIIGGTGDDAVTGGTGNDRFTYTVGDGHDTITDFNAGNTGTLSDGDNTNNDFIDLSGFYDNLSELYADQADDGILNQSNTTDSKGRSTDYSDNSQFGSGSMRMQGASADNSSFSEENTGVVCFTSGTAIRTPRGDVLIDDLKVGDLVNTMDNGPQRIRWIGNRIVGKQELMANPKLRPILIKRGILSAERDLLVSPQHGVLIEPEHLARATHLIKRPGIRIANGKREVTYFHVMFDAHQIIFAENVPSESFFPGPMALSATGESETKALFELIPELRMVGSQTHAERIYGSNVRPFLRRHAISSA